MIKLVLEHFIPSLIIALIVFFFFKKRYFLFLLPFLTGTLIDADHLLDFLLAYRKNFWKYLKTCATGDYFVTSGRIIVLLHSWEFVLLWFLFWLHFQRIDVAIIGSFSWIVHLFIDHMCYNLHPAAYFLTYRIYKKFNIQAICMDKS